MTDYVKMPIVDLDDVGEYINSPKQKKLMNRLYHLEEFNKMLTEIIDNYIEQVVHMTDDELVIDRSNFIKNYSIAHNKEVGGVPTSSHLLGLAVDIRCANSRERFDLINVLLKKGFNRIGIGSTFIHVDIDLDKSPNVIWTY